MRGTALALACLVLLVLAREGKGEGKGEGNTMRLCGRDFVRAVVFTCGGSRWRRHLTDYPYLLADGENPQPLPHEGEGDSDFSSSPEQRLGIHSEETQDVKREQDLQNTGETSVLNRREAAKLLTTSCCTVGCSRTDISSLC